MIKKGDSMKKTALSLFLCVIISVMTACSPFVPLNSDPAEDVTTDSTQTGGSVADTEADEPGTDTEPVTVTDTEAETEPPAPPPPKESKVSFLAVGDNIIYNGQIREAKTNAKNTDGLEHDFSPMYANVAEIISSYDLAFVNQETPLAGKQFGYDHYPSFNSPQELGDDLIEAGFDIFNIATNHMLDKGEDGLAGTMSYFKSKDVMMVGGYEDENDFYNIRIIEKNDIKIAVVGLTYGVNGKAHSADAFIPYIYEKDLTKYKNGAAPVDSGRIEKWIEKAEEAADVVIVSMHWGVEYNQKPNAEQRRLAGMIADAGADIILGHHTHCIQPIEWIEGKGGNKTLCFFSLGNFTSETDETVSLVGGIAAFDMILNEKEGLRIENVSFLPTVMDYRAPYAGGNKFEKNTVYLLENYTEDLCRSHSIVSYFGKKLNMALLRGYVSNAIDTKYLPKSYLDTLS